MEMGDENPVTRPIVTDIGLDEFREMLEQEFPGTLAKAADLCGEGLIHIEVGAFRRSTEEAIDAGNLELAERHFKFIENVWPRAQTEVDDAIGVSYVEDFAHECTPTRHAFAKVRLSPELRAKLIAINPLWK